jgi:uncharacterized protein (DUF2236 family)
VFDQARPAPGALFDEHSVSWRLVSRWPVLAGGPAAILLQVAHPSVAAGVSGYSSFNRDPFGRLERTLAAMLAISFGTPDRRESVLAELRAVHRRVRGTRSDGQAYAALQPDLQLWVWATLVHVAIEVDRRYVRSLTAADRETYYAESTELARAFLVPGHQIPADLAAFESYVRATVAGLEVSDEARAVARDVLHPRAWWAPRPVFVPVEWVTVDLLDRRLAADFGLPLLAAGPRRALRGTRRLTRSVLPRLPEPLLANPYNKRAICST